jgi:hypothetical protein
MEYWSRLLDGRFEFSGYVHVAPDSGEQFTGFATFTGPLLKVEFEDIYECASAEVVLHFLLINRIEFHSGHSKSSTEQDLKTIYQKTSKSSRRFSEGPWILDGNLPRRT